LTNLLKTKLERPVLGMALLLLIIFYIFQEYNQLGLFADDIPTIYRLSGDLSFGEILHIAHVYDAARDLHLVWQKIFIDISKPKIISNIHFYQLTFYLINSVILYFIIIKLGITVKNSFICLLFFISFPLYAEVAFWTHAFSMVLMSGSFFLLFIICNLQIVITQKNKFVLEVFSIIFIFLNIFTYEQSIVVSFFIILLREFFILKENKKRLTFSIIIISFYLVIIILFSVYKLYAAGVFDVGPKSNFTGSSFSSPQQWLLNLKRGYGLFIVNLFNFDLFKQLSKENLYIISSLTIGLYFYLSSFKILKYKNNFKISSYKVFICIVLYTLAFIPLYIHYISDRHFYIPSIFAIIGFGFILNEVSTFSENTKKSSFLFNLLISVFIINNFINFGGIKNTYINNFQLKKDFYTEIIHLEDIKNISHIALLDFPDLNDDVIFFAHEQMETLNLFFKDDKLPKIVKINDMRPQKDNVIVKYIEIKNKKIIYKIYD